jgi:hypothetical protein
MKYHKGLSIVLSVAVIQLVRGNCPNSCSGHGYCGKTLQCTCHRGYYGADCSERSCPAGGAWFGLTSTVDGVHSMETECSNAGNCDRGSGKCNCYGAFEGRACERMGCHKNCNGNGVCISLREAAVLKDDLHLFYSTTYSLWDADKIYGCICDQGYTGYDCSIRTCIKGHDYFSNFDTYVDEVQAFKCHQNSGAGTFKIKFRGQTSASVSTATTAADMATILKAMPSIDDVIVTDNNGATSGAICRSSSNTWDFKVTFTRQHGNVPTLEILHSTVSPSLEYVSSSSITGTKTYEVCNNRGLCDESTGLCKCDTSFGSSNGKGTNVAGSTNDCGYISVALTSCPGTTSCSGHGTCSGTPYYRCSCYVGFMGSDCSLRTCPFDIAWWDEPTGTNTAHGYAECSNRGLCDRGSGKCECMKGFTGQACQRTSCEKGGQDGSDCNGAGSCKSLRHAAKHRMSNGIAAAASFGETPGNVNTWTADKIYGCVCHEGQFEYDVYGNVGNACELKACPYGDDPFTLYVPGSSTVAQVDEVQMLTCSATSGTFFLTFRGRTTSAIKFDAPAESSYVSLSAGTVSVTYGSAIISTTADWTSFLASNDNINVYSTTQEAKNFTVSSVSSNSITVSFPVGFATESGMTVKKIVNSVKYELENLSTIGTVGVSFSTGNVACASSGIGIAITFKDNSGDLPLITSDVTGLIKSGGSPSISVAQTTAGTKEFLECNNRGACDRTKGVCKCFKGMVSSAGAVKSNGKTIVGQRGDCGARDALYIRGLRL